MKSKGIHAASTYLKLNEYEILDYYYSYNDDCIDIVAIDDEGTIVFINTYVCDKFPEIKEATNEERAAKEELAVKYLTDNEHLPKTQIRFDRIYMIVVGKDRAFCRHEKNVLN